ncbi:MAG: transglycosylase SLT domain-containing protein [Bacteroidetes bacterium]|nr:transglycosylase SLT domain-containing protein [Bacteroidota bacterium]
MRFLRGFFVILFIGFSSSWSVFAQKLGDELIQTRLAALKPQLELVYHPEVKKFIEEYLANPDKTREIIGASKYYFPMIERTFKIKSVPADLKYLAVVASDLQPQANNASGNSGIWMMAYNVSKMYKLKVTTYIDERRDPIKSTQISASHFRDLFSIYKSWPLAIAAYGCSPVTLNKCIRMAGNSLYFWDVYNYLPTTCRDLYPRYVAAVYVMNYYKEHGIKSVLPDIYEDVDTVVVNKWLSFQQISSTLGVSIEDLRKLNPEFKKDVIPFNLDGYVIKLPKSKGKMFYLLNDTVYRNINPTDFTPVEIRKVPEKEADSAITEEEKESKIIKHGQAEKENTFDKKRVFYVVKKGDNLADIADWFDVSAAEIKSWNKLRKQQVNKGKKLTIWVKASKTGYYKRINSMSLKQKKKLKRKD